ncbi:metallo-beta-lactamase [Acetobacter tropicalis NRIC 0312]|uniref:Metallo-beta-lactamase domain-containing protein n=2 Tax=Acetobacter tropicalis TaxID=104102 RepID=A0A511FMT2_9PROT|nr:beta-lactamase [Acetobacter tropicalis]GBR71213.1 metallo-beta-lactamase [Acetobacter tropicalis NRIC 0312]GEL49998.1 hypothetical protein ATR01nite_10730 [Acetobacter tropicalis]
MHQAYSGMQLQVIPVTPFRQNCSVLWNEATRHAVVVDPGGDADVLGQFIRQNGLNVEAILLTHGHLDHAGGVAALSRLLAKQQKVLPVIIGPTAEDGFLLSSIENQARHFGLEELENAKVDRYVVEGEQIQAAGRTFDVIHVPGHTPGHVVFVDKAAKFAFVGDTLFRGTIGRTDFPYGDGDLLVRSIKEKLLPLGDDIVIMPGHGGSSTLGAERMNNPFLCAG